MCDLFELQQGKSPLLINMPHSGTEIPASIKNGFTDSALQLSDTDWFIPELYGFTTDTDITVLQANYSRLVIDLNRPSTNETLYPGQVTTDLCPVILFDGGKVYQSENTLTDKVIEERIQEFWHPYHSQLQHEINRIKSIHGFCILYDAHSIRSQVPMLFEGALPELNLGTNYGDSCDSDLQSLVTDALGSNQEFSWVVNGRFIGGFITRHYGNREDNTHAIQMEIAQSSYMNEHSTPEFKPEQAVTLQSFLQLLVQDLQQWQPP